MTEPFNPYHTWLGIPPEEQPANHYRLLGLKDFEANADVISNASDQRLAHLRTLQIGKNRERSQALLNEVAAAAGCLLNAKRKLEYDQQLRQEQAVAAAKVAAAKPLPFAMPLRRADPVPPPVAPPQMKESAAFPSHAIVAQAPTQSIGRPLALISITLVSLLLAAIIFFTNFNNSNRQPQQNAASDPQPVPLPEVPQSPPSLHPEPAIPPIANATAVPSPEPMQPTLPPMPVEIAASEKTIEPTPTPTPEVPRHQLPNEAELVAARTEFTNDYADDVRRASSPELKQVFLRKLTTLANDRAADPARLYVVLDNARGLNIASGEAAAALAVVEQMGQSFDLAPAVQNDLRFATLSALSDAPLNNAQRELLADQLSHEIDAALRARRFAVADECSRLGLKVTKGLKEPERKRLAAQQRTAIIQLNAELAPYEQAQTILAKSPADPAANLTAGKFLCSVLGDWEQGRSHLAASGISSLTSVIAADLNAAQSPTDEAIDLQLLVADQWFEWAASSQGSDPQLLNLARLRAQEWYQKAAPSLAGLNRAKAEKRLKDLLALGLVSRQITITRPTVATAAKSPMAEQIKNSHVDDLQRGDSGLWGLIHIDDVPQKILIRYQPGQRILSADFDQLLQPIRRPGQRVRIVFEGLVVIPTDGEYVLAIAGGSSSRGVHTLSLRGEQLIQVGDNRRKDDTRTVSLPKGEHPLRWELAGGLLGDAQLDVRLVDSANADSPRPMVVTSPDKIEALRKQTEQEVPLGSAAR